MTGGLDDRFDLATAGLRKCVEESIIILKDNPGMKGNLDDRWVQFFGQFLDYVRRREKETGIDLLKGISLAKLIKLW